MLKGYENMMTTQRQRANFDEKEMLEPSLND